MSFKIFYAWQSDRPNKYNGQFIGKCLKEAMKRLKAKYKNNNPDFFIDRDTKDVSGWPNIPESIFGKIDSCDVFLGDLTSIGLIYDTGTGSTKHQLNNNVVAELMYAYAKIGEGRIINVMNAAYGDPSQNDIIPFDFSQRRFPILYSLNETNEHEIANIEESLTTDLYNALKLIFDTEHERQKDEYKPFETWRTWDDNTEKEFRFKRNDYIQSVFDKVRAQAIKNKSATRILGLSGLGKTRLLLECFRPSDQVNSELTSNILYADMNVNSENEILSKCKELYSNRANKTIVLDNCSIQFHGKIRSTILNNDSQLKLVTISTYSDEDYQEVDSSGKTEIIKLEARRFNDVVARILKENFTELEDEEIDLLVDYSNGLSLYAKLMAGNTQRGKHLPGSLSPGNVVDRLLGDLYSNPESRAIVQACCLFSKFGFFDELEFQSEQIARNGDLCNLVFNGVNPDDIETLKRQRFKEVCLILHKRQLLEKIGRTFSFRPSPLAIKLAEDWWRYCTVEKFQRIVPILKDLQLVESFCEQFRNLKHIDHAKEIVGELCDGVFSLAEVLNSSVGSRLFRSFVDVNPVACNKALERAFLKMSKEEIESVTEGRRNLVWALEKLCFRVETFDNAAKVMAAFSVGENENIGNNATNQFLQLFHIILPGTSISLERRWEILEYCLAKDENYVELGIRILNSSLAVGNFHRIGGAEDQGDLIQLVDYNPSGTEILDYWKKAIDKLSEFAFNRGQYSEKAISILLENFYGLCSQGGGQIILPVIEKIIKEDLIGKMEARKKVQFVLNSKRVFDSSVLVDLQRIFEFLTPISILDKFSIYVQSPSSDEYFPEGSEGGGHESLLKKIDIVANEFYSEKENWNDLSGNLVTGNIYEGYNFGKALSKTISSDFEKLELLKLLTSKLFDTPKELRNISVIIGLLSGVDDKQIQVKIFNDFLSSAHIRDLSFAIARSIELPFEEINKLLMQTNEGIFPTSQFSSFEYGWGIKHLDFSKVVLIIDTLRSIDKMGKAVSFFTLMKWSHANPDIWDIYKLKIRELILEDSKDIFETMQGTMDYYYWSDPIIKLLDEIDDSEFADFILTLIIDQCKDFEGFYSKENSFYRVLEKIQEKYFDLFWKHVSDLYNNASEFGLAAFHFKSLLGSRQDAYANSEGLLFKGDKQKFEIVFEWCKGKNLSVVSRIAELLPIYQANGDGSFGWHPYAKKFIDEFGENKEVLGYISAKIGTYSWIGSVVPKLERDLMLFTMLVDHPFENVRIWAQLHVQDLEKKIKAESDRDADDIWI